MRVITLSYNILEKNQSYAYNHFQIYILKKIKTSKKCFIFNSCLIYVKYVAHCDGVFLFQKSDLNEKKSVTVVVVTGVVLLLV